MRRTERAARQAAASSRGSPAGPPAANVQGSIRAARPARLYSVVRLGPPTKVPAGSRGFHSVARTDKELSIVCRADQTPRGGRREDGFRCLEVAGPLPFEATGVLAALAAPLARARIPILAISTFDTDYLFVRQVRLREVVRALVRAGHAVRVE
ncbi:MAG TPA: ACT domain-containing protein [Thermoanaerobaculia bacterium]|nr:ACT domain-containing protein [Thermoanaerobaculia bacterium]HEV8611579.1 ACT domain-containing protein [Thermoanaerobaculia bacterium]